VPNPRQDNHDNEWGRTRVKGAATRGEMARSSHAECAKHERGQAKGGRSGEFHANLEPAAGYQGDAGTTRPEQREQGGRRPGAKGGTAIKQPSRLAAAQGPPRKVQAAGATIASDAVYRTERNPRKSRMERSINSHDKAGVAQSYRLHRRGAQFKEELPMPGAERGEPQ